MADLSTLNTPAVVALSSLWLLGGSAPRLSAKTVG